MKVTATNYFVREIYGDASQLMDAREEISRGDSAYGVKWRFEEVDRDTFLEEVEADTKVCCIKTKGNKYIEVDKSSIDKFNL